MAMGAEEVHRVITALVDAANEQAARVDASEREVKAVADALASLMRHHQSEMLEVRGHLAVLMPTWVRPWLRLSRPSG